MNFYKKYASYKKRKQGEKKTCANPKKGTKVQKEGAISVIEQDIINGFPSAPLPVPGTSKDCDDDDDIRILSGELKRDTHKKKK